MSLRRATALAAILLLAGCDKNDPTQPALRADLASDVTAPELTAFDFTPKSINTSTGSAGITVDFTVTDDLSGATFVRAVLESPSGLTDRDGTASLDAATSESGSFTITFPQYSEAGTWKVIFFETCDAVGNCLELRTGDIAALGFPTDLRVQNTVPVSIDIEPGSSGNPIKLSRQGKVVVAILSDAGLDAPSEVDRTSLTFGHTGNEASLASCATEGEDVNGDGFQDLVCRFYVQRTGFQVGDVEGVLRGRTVDQIPIQGKDAVRILK